MRWMVLMVLTSVFFGFSLLSFAGGPPKVTPELLEKGKTIFTVNCVTCHGEKGDGNGPAGAYMNPKPRNFSTDKLKVGNKPEQLFKTITQGLTGTAMAGFGHLSEDDRWAVSLYVRETFMTKKKK